MNQSERSEVLRGADHAEERRGDRDAGGAPRELHPNEPSPPQDGAGPQAPNRIAFESYVGGAGI